MYITDKHLCFDIYSTDIYSTAICEKQCNFWKLLLWLAAALFVEKCKSVMLHAALNKVVVGVLLTTCMPSRMCMLLTICLLLIIGMLLTMCMLLTVCMLLTMCMPLMM